MRRFAETDNRLKNWSSVYYLRRLSDYISVYCLDKNNYFLIKNPGGKVQIKITTFNDFY